MSEERGAAARRFAAAHRLGLALTLGGLLALGLWLLLALPLLLQGEGPAVGRPSPADVQAPRAIRYESQILTERAREDAASSVPTSFGEQDPTIGREQVQRARDTLRLVALHRATELSGREEALADLAAVEPLVGLGDDTLEQLLDLDDATWAAVGDEIPKVLALAMRSPTRPDSLASARNSVVAYVDRNLDPETANLVAEIARRFVVPDSLVDEEATERARQAAREAVEPVYREFVAGEIIVREGEIVSALALEAQEALGLSRRSTTAWDLLGLVLVSLTVVGVAAASLWALAPDAWRRTRRLATGVGLLLLFAAGSAIALASQPLVGAAFPAAALAITLAAVYGFPSGAVAALILAAFGGVASSGSLEIALLYLLAGLAGAAAIGRVERLSSILWAGGAVLAVSLAVLMAFHLPEPNLTGADLLELGGAALAHAAIATGIAALGVLAAGPLFGVTTSLQLLELARPDQPLLRDLQVKAPGTYQHSLVLANLAERAAAAIGADAVLVRVGAYYHDVGKIVRPYFFIENQVGGANPHDAIGPEESARVIIDHVPDDAALARRAGLPERVIDFIWQHHGTSRVEYFYRTAIAEQGEEAVDEARYRYPGPRPQSPEAALIMLADGAEAAVRAGQPQGVEEIRAIVTSIVEARLYDGQLEDCALTMMDLRDIRDAFVSTLQSMYHPRVKYPDQKGALPAPAPQVTAAPTADSEAAGANPGPAGEARA